MGLLDDVREEQEGRRAGGNRCLLCQLADGEDDRLPEGDRAELEGVLGDPRIFASTIIAVLKRRGVEVTDAQVGNHRRKHVDGWDRR